MTRGLCSGKLGERVHAPGEARQLAPFTRAFAGRNRGQRAERQGMNRLERGRNAYYTAQDIARERGWAFNWKLVEVPGVGHSARRMFGSAQALDALSAK